MCSTLSGLLEFSPVLLRYFISGMGLLLELDSVHIQQCCSVNYQHIVKVPSVTYSKVASFFVILYDKWEEKTKTQRRRGMVIFHDVLSVELWARLCSPVQSICLSEQKYRACHHFPWLSFLSGPPSFQFFSAQLSSFIEAVKRSCEDPADDFHLFNSSLSDCVCTPDESQLTQSHSCVIPSALIHTMCRHNAVLSSLASSFPPPSQTANEVNHNCFSPDPFTPTADGERLHPQYSFNQYRE